MLLIAVASGAVGLWLSFSAFAPYSPCEFANNNILFIKEQTQQAIAAPDLKMSRYYAYKALNGIWNAQYSFSECGCEDAITSMDLASDNLKEATRADSVEDSKTFLQIAMKNTRNGINAIDEYKNNLSKYGNDVLSLNISETKNISEAEPKNEESSDLSRFSVKKIEESLDKYSKSIDNVVKINDCAKAREFILSTRKKTEADLLSPDLSQRKHYYHNRVLQITKEALNKLEGCSGQSLLARK